MGRQKRPHRACGYRLAVILEGFDCSKKFATSQCARSALAYCECLANTPFCSPDACAGDSGCHSIWQATLQTPVFWLCLAALAGELGKLRSRPTKRHEHPL